MKKVLVLVLSSLTLHASSDDIKKSQQPICVSSKDLAPSDQFFDERPLFRQNDAMLENTVVHELYPSRSPFLYEHPYCLPEYAWNEQQVDARATFAQYPQFGTLNGVAQSLVFNLVTKTLTASGYASQVNPTTNSGSATAAGTQLTYDMIALIRFNYLTNAVDTTFNPNKCGFNFVNNGTGFAGTLLTNLGSTARAIKMALKTDGGGNPQLIYTTGYTNALSTNTWQLFITSYTLTGSFNPVFNRTANNQPVVPGMGLPPFGVVITSFSNVSDQALAIALQQDGKILVTGQSAGQLFVARFTTTGVLDTTFNPTGLTTLFNPRTGAITLTVGFSGLQPGVFLASIVGTYSIANTGTSILGSDIGFGIVVQPDGKIVVAGTGTNQYGYRKIIVARLTTTGVLDTTFGPGTLTEVYSQQFVRQTGVVVTTMDYPHQFATQNMNYSNQFVIMNYSNQFVIQNGKPVTTIKGINDQGLAIALQADNKILVAGTTFNPNTGRYQMALVRYTTSGIVDTSFGVVDPKDYEINPPLGKISLRIITNVGQSTNIGQGLGFNLQPSVNALANAVAVQADGKIVISGFNQVANPLQNTQMTYAFARFLPNGALDINGFNASSLVSPQPQPGVQTVSILGSNDKSFGMAIQPITPPATTTEYITAIGSSLSNNYQAQSYLAQYYGFSAVRLFNTGLVDFTSVAGFPNQQ